MEYAWVKKEEQPNGKGGIEGGVYRLVEGTPTIMDIESFIVAERYVSPRNWQADLGLYRGSAFGLAHNLFQLSVLRPRIRHPKIHNLYRVGASTRPGNGVPLVMVGARLTAEAVVRDIG